MISGSHISSTSVGRPLVSQLSSPASLLSHLSCWRPETRRRRRSSLCESGFNFQPDSYSADLTTHSFSFIQKEFSCPLPTANFQPILSVQRFYLFCFPTRLDLTGLDARFYFEMRNFTPSDSVPIDQAKQSKAEGLNSKLRQEKVQMGKKTGQLGNWATGTKELCPSMSTLCPH